MIIRPKKKKRVCQECKSYGGYKEVILDDGSGPWYDCGWCGGTGFISSKRWGMWANWRKELKAIRKGTIKDGKI